MSRALDLADVVLGEVVEMVEALDKHGAMYAKRYLAHIVDGATRPVTPLGLHPKVAHAIREVVLDEASVVGAVPARYR